MTDDYLRAFSGAVKHDSPNHYPSLKYRSGHHKPKGVATMFIWTIGDLIGAVLGGLALIFFGGLFLAIKIQDWQLDRKRRTLLKQKAAREQ